MNDLYYEPKKKSEIDVLKELNRLLKNDLHYVTFLHQNEFEIAQAVTAVKESKKIELSKIDTFLIDYDLVISILNHEAFAVINRTNKEQDEIAVKNIERITGDRMKLKGV